MLTTDYFKCQSCGLAYLAVREERAEQHAGMIDCVECKKVAYEWAGHYELSDWHPIPLGDPLIRR
jgi:hypothetical protein